MALLTKCVYGYETDPKKTPFGLLNNQLRGDSIINNAGWFNFDGERIGSGDLSLKDLNTIAQHLPKNEAFIVLSEADSGFDLPSDLDRTAPGRDYVLRKMVWIVISAQASDKTTGTAILRIRDNSGAKSEAIKKDGVPYIRMPRKEMYEALNQPAAPPPKPDTNKKSITDDELAEIWGVKKKLAGSSKLKSSTSKSGTTGSSSLPKSTPVAKSIKKVIR